MPMSANDRYSIEAAPGQLSVVQELLNTASAGVRAPGPDLLADLGAAQDWAGHVLDSAGLATGPVTSKNLQALRHLRDVLRDVIHHRDGEVGTVGEDGAAGEDEPAAAVPLVAHEPETVLVEISLHDGPAALHPTGSVAASLRGLILAEVLLAQTRGDWGRLKLCALPACDLAFYDTTRNRSARWHAARCGNAVNLARSRARTRTI